jgi:hypothetical protein
MDEKEIPSAERFSEKAARGQAAAAQSILYRFSMNAQE